MESVTRSELELFLEPEMNNSGKSEIDPLAGIIFHPTDEENIIILNHKKTHLVVHSPIFEANIYDYEPSQIPGLGAVQTGGKWWNFFCVLEALDDSGKRFRRSTSTGYWKQTGEPVKIKAKRTDEVIGEKRTLVFHERHRGGSNGRSKEVRTNWVMREYSANTNPQIKVIDECASNLDFELRWEPEYVVCYLFRKCSSRLVTTTSVGDAKDLVICRIKLKEDKKRHISTKIFKNKRAKKHLVSTNDEGQPSHIVAFDNGTHDAEKSSLKSKLLPSRHLISKL